MSALDGNAQVRANILGRVRSARNVKPDDTQRAAQLGAHGPYGVHILLRP